MKLFVYGLLLSGSNSSMHTDFVQRFQARLGKSIKTAPKYDLISVGSIAFLIAGKTAVLGEVYEVPRPMVEERIDQWERMYERREVVLEDGTKADAYFAKVIPNGDFLTWREEEDRRWRAEIYRSKEK